MLNAIWHQSIRLLRSIRLLITKNSSTNYVTKLSDVFSGSFFMNCDSVDHLFDVLLALTLQMKKQLLSLLIWVITIGTYSQISFENGYYITNSNEKVVCQIRNVDW